MEEINNILDYFINYEIENRLSNIELKRKKYTNIEDDDLKNITYIKDKILQKKLECIKNIIKRVEWRNIDKK